MIFLACIFLIFKKLLTILFFFHLSSHLSSDFFCFHFHFPWILLNQLKCSGMKIAQAHPVCPWSELCSRTWSCLGISADSKELEHRVGVETTVVLPLLVPAGFFPTPLISNWACGVSCISPTLGLIRNIHINHTKPQL